MTARVPASQHTGRILALFWGSMLVSLTLPWALQTVFEVSAHRRTIAEALKHVALHLFAPGSNYFLVGALSAVPFAVCAVFLLFHLGWNPTLEPPQYARRLAGVLGSLLLMLGVSFWTHVSALLYPDAQGAVVYLFLPAILIVLIPVGYGAGRLALAFTRLLRPSERDASPLDN